jgi:hypothetical protein
MYNLKTLQEKVIVGCPVRGCNHKYILLVKNLFLKKVSKHNSYIYAKTKFYLKFY